MPNFLRDFSLDMLISVMLIKKRVILNFFSLCPRRWYSGHVKEQHKTLYPCFRCCHRTHHYQCHTLQILLNFKPKLVSSSTDHFVGHHFHCYEYHDCSAQTESDKLFVPSSRVAMGTTCCFVFQYLSDAELIPFDVVSTDCLDGCR